MTKTRIAHRIAALKESEAEMLHGIAEYNALALAGHTQGQYEKWARRANDLERIACRIASDRQALEALVAPVAA